MTQRAKSTFLAILIIVGLSVILKIYCNASIQDILFLFLFGSICGLITALVRGYFNPPSWLYKIRSSVFGAFYGISIGILDFGSSLTNGKAFSWHELVVSIVIGVIVGVAFYSILVFFQQRKLQIRKGLLPAEEPILKDFVFLINADGVKTTGKLVLTNKHVFFLPNKNDGNLLEREVHEIRADISRTKYLRIPNGFSIENGAVSFQLPFPFYWLKTIRQIGS